MTISYQVEVPVIVAGLEALSPEATREPSHLFMNSKIQEDMILFA